MQRKHYPIIGIILIISATLLVDYFGYRHVAQMGTTQTFETDYGSVSEEDRAPLPIPEELLHSGRALTIPILMYHHIGDVPAGADKVRIGLTIPTQEFEQQVNWLKKSGYTSVSLEDILLRAQGKTKITWPKKPIVFTFDDGYSDVFENAIPILKKNGYTASFAIITQWPGNSFGTNQYATWRQIAAAKQQGMEIVCHTQNHFDGKNKKYSTEYIFQNISGCQQDITAKLGSAKPIMVYPYGHYTPAYIDQAKKAGIAMALTVHEGNKVNLDDLLETSRVRVSPHEDMAVFARLLGEEK